MCSEWRRGPYGLDGAMGATLGGRKTVLVVVHHLAAANRLADVVSLVERDRRLQMVFTRAPASVLNVGVAEYLQSCGGIVVPWSQAVNTEWDLAIAAGDGALEQIHGPVLWLPHGVGPIMRSHRWNGAGRQAVRPIAGMRPEAFVAGGRVIPSVIAVAREDHRAFLIDASPEVADSVAVVGDLAFDRLVASRPLREAYRRRLGVKAAQRLVVVSSTWGPRSLLSQHEDLLVRLAADLPRERYRVVGVLHPNVWTWHSRRTIRTWFDDCLSLGVQLLPPEEGWRAALVAADRVIGDYGSVTHTAAAARLPVLLATFPDDDVLPGSPADLLRKIAPRLDLAGPLRAQVDDAYHAYSANDYATFQHRLTAAPGQSARLWRRVLYRLLRLPEPNDAPRLDPVPLPEPIRAIEP